MNRNLKLCKKGTSKITVGYRNLKSGKLQSLTYADDIIVMSEGRDERQKLVDKWNNVIEHM